MWSQVGEIAISKGENTLSLTDIATEATIYDVFIGIQPPFDAEPCQRIAAKDYTQSHQGHIGYGSARQRGLGELKTIPQLGYQDGVMVVPCLTDSYEPTDLSEAPWLEYNVKSSGEKGRSSESRQARLNGRVVTDEGEANGLVEIRTLPTLRVYTGRQARYAVSIDGGTPQVFDIHEDDYSAEWRWNVLRGYTRRWLPISQGRHTVRVYLLDPGIVLQEVVTFKLCGTAALKKSDGIGWGGMAINAAAIDPRIKAIVASTMTKQVQSPSTRWNSSSKRI